MSQSIEAKDTHKDVTRLILGSGRSGTTWVQDCLAEANGLRPVFEPLHPGDSEIGRRYAYRVLTADDDEPQLQEFFAGLISGEIRSRWTDFRAPRGLLFPKPSRFMTSGFAARWKRGWKQYLHDRRALAAATQRRFVVIKCIRANLMAGWATRRLGLKTVLVVRHPCAAVESQFRLGRVWDPTTVLSDYSDNAYLHEVTDGRYVELLKSKLTGVQALTLKWIIENQWPMSQSASDGYAVIYYEDLLEDTNASWRHLCDVLDLADTPDPSLLRTPSQQAARRTVDGGAGQQKPRWMSALDAKQLSMIQEILDATGFGDYRVDRAGPCK